MKLILVVVAILGFAHAQPVQRTLTEDIYEFIDLVPVDEIKAIISKYYAQGDLTTIIEYLKGEDFAAIVTAVRQTPESQQVAAYLTEVGIDYAKIYNYVKEVLNRASARNSQVSAKSLSDFWTELKAAFPVEEFRALWRSKLETSADFQDFVAKLSSETFKSLVEQTAATPEFQNLLQKGRDVGLDIDGWVGKIYGYLGW